MNGRLNRQLVRRFILINLEIVEIVRDSVKSHSYLFFDFAHSQLISNALELQIKSLIFLKKRQFDSKQPVTQTGCFDNISLIYLLL